jgi:hypothetical protein
MMRAYYVDSRQCVVFVSICVVISVFLVTMLGPSPVWASETSAGGHDSLWSEKAYRTRTILLGSRDEGLEPETPDRLAPQSLGSGYVFLGATESTQSTEWFEVSLVTSSTTCVIIRATINTVLISPATVSTELFH